jgi:HSP20 family molecular chaperone IbpA
MGMNTPRRYSWMWADACALLDQAEARHRHFFELLAAPATSPTWEPPANIFSRDTDWWVEVALPGARSDDVRIQLGTTGLLIEATVAPPEFSRGVNVVRLEIPYGRMRRRVDLPPGRYVLREHRLENGYLFLHLSGGAS